MFDGAPSSETDPAERRARLRLARSPRIGPVSFHEALQHFGSARAACAQLTTVGAAVIGQEERRLTEAGGRFLVIGDAAYPLGPRIEQAEYDQMLAYVEWAEANAPDDPVLAPRQPIHLRRLKSLF